VKCIDPSNPETGMKHRGIEKAYNILFVGECGSGKSSSINTIASCFSEQFQAQAHVGHNVYITRKVLYRY